jgi:alpha-L-fucosidase
LALAPADWGVTTQNSDKVYVHILKWNAPLLALPPLQRTIKAAQLLSTGSSVEFTQTSSGVVLKLPAPATDEVDRVIIFTLEMKT